MSTARLKEMLLQKDMFREHQYRMGWAAGRGAFDKSTRVIALRRTSCKHRDVRPSSAMWRMMATNTQVYKELRVGTLSTRSGSIHHDKWFASRGNNTVSPRGADSFVVTWRGIVDEPPPLRQSPLPRTCLAQRGTQRSALGDLRGKECLRERDLKLAVHLIEKVLGAQEEVVDLAALLVPLGAVVDAQLGLLGEELADVGHGEDDLLHGAIQTHDLDTTEATLERRVARGPGKSPERQRVANFDKAAKNDRTPVSAYLMRQDVDVVTDVERRRGVLLLVAFALLRRLLHLDLALHSK
ncbi:hypothetical protein EYF80_048508 [Liparis tanakae]|uniref:Uncharacterized protein n=1 Tax=Liparis tanakae TaxID=230148 RepID=A0A4Z2FKQ1_9TELE|nr:hypothetical protein EYF80_048508 [Liparis tanakae]